MKIKEAIYWGRKYLGFSPDYFLDVEILLAESLRKNRIYLKTHPEEKIPPLRWLQFKHQVKKRKNKIPIAYLLGYKKWNNLKIVVTPATLIPRDETEILCHHIKRDSQSFANNPTPKILDIGTGSGCIAIWLKKHFPHTYVNATDISRPALNIARINAANYKTKIHLIQSDLLENIEDKTKFDCIVANLPYVPINLKVSEEVQKEPSNAIFSGSDGLDHLRLLARQLKSKSIYFTSLWLEFLPNQKDEIVKIFNQHTIKFFDDGGGNIFFAKIS